MRGSTRHSGGSYSRSSSRGSLLLRPTAAAAFALCLIWPTARAQFVATDIFIADQQYVSPVSRGASGGVFRFDVAAGGVRRLLSDFGNPMKGPLGSGSPQGVTGIVVETPSTLLVTDRGGGTNGAGQVFRINASGMRTVVTDFGNAAQGPVAVQPTGAVLNATGQLLVGTLQVNGAKPLGVLFRVNRSTGLRAVVSDGNDPAQGQVLAFYGLAVEANGSILAVDVIRRGVNNRGVLVRVDPGTGRRTVLSDFGNATQGTLGQNPTAIALEDSGSILVICQRGGAISSNVGALFRVDPISGRRTVVTDFSDPNPLKGPPGKVPTGVAVDPLGTILVVDIAASQNNFSGSLFKVNPVTGVRERLDDFAVPAGEPVGQTPSGVVPMQVCGDGRPDRLEECDDGNTVNGDGCSNQCKVEPGFFACAKRIATIVGKDDRDDELIGSKGADVIHGRGGHDRIFGNAGRDVLCGGAGNDFIRGGSSNDVIEGGPGNDILIGDNGKDDIKGQDGDDLMRGGENSDTCDGGRHRTGDTAINCERVLNVP